MKYLYSTMYRRMDTLDHNSKRYARGDRAHELAKQDYFEKTSRHDNGENGENG